MSDSPKMFKQSVIYAIGNISRQLVAFIMLPIYTRFLSTADYGVIGLFSLAMVVVDQLLGARLFAAVSRFYFEADDQKKSNSIVSTALILTFLISIISTVGLVLFSTEISSLLFGEVDYAAFVAVYAISFLTGPVEHYGLQYMRIKERPIHFVVTSLAKLAVQLSLNIWLIVYMEMGIMGVAVSATASSMLFAVLMAIYVVRETGFRFSRDGAILMVKFSWPLWFSGLAAIYIFSSSRYYLRIFDTLDSVGLLELATKFSTVLMIALWEPFIYYWQPQRFQIYYAGDCERKFRSVFSVMVALMVIASLGISIFADPVIRIMADVQFHAAAQIVPIVVLGALFGAFPGFLDFGMMIKDRTSWISHINYFVAFVITAFCVLAIPIWGLLAAAIAQCIASLLILLLSQHFARKLFDPGISLLPLFALTAFASLGYYLANHAFAQEGMLLDFAVKVGVYAVFSAIILSYLMFNKDTKSQCLEFLQTLDRYRMMLLRSGKA